MLNEKKTRFATLDDRLCGAMIGGLSRPLGGAVYAGAYALAAALGFLSARLLGGAGMVEGLLFAAVFVLWCAALFVRSRVRIVDALLLGGALFALFASRMAALPVISPDCRDYLIPWAEAMSSMTFQEVMVGRVGDYTVLFQYFVFLLSRLPVNPVAIYKLMPIAFEAMLAYAAAGLSCHARGEGKDSARWRVVFFAVLALPTVFLNGAVWSQCDAAYASLALLGVLLVLRDRPHAGCVSLALSLCLKLQAVFLLPICALLLFYRKLSLRHALTALLTLLLVCVPALLCGKGIKGVLGVYLYQMGEYKQLVLDAPTIYQLIPGGALIPESAATTIGILLAAGAMCAILAIGARSKHPCAALIIDLCFALCLAIPFLLPHMHERYFFLADVLALVYAAAHPLRAYAPAIVVLSSLNGYCAYLFSTPLMRWTIPTLAMLLLLAATIALLVRDTVMDRA